MNSRPLRKFKKYYDLAWFRRVGFRLGAGANASQCGFRLGAGANGFPPPCTNALPERTLSFSITVLIARWHRSGRHESAPQLPKLGRAAPRGLERESMYSAVCARLHRAPAQHSGLLGTVKRLFLSRLGRPEADRQALYRRAEAAAKNAAAGYETHGDLVIGCMCIGQPHDEEEPIPQLEGCKRHPDLWTLPKRPSQIRLAFLWYIAKRGAGESGTRVGLVLRRALGPCGAGWRAATARLRSRGCSCTRS